MARYTGPVCKLCRREGQKLFLKGTKCYTEKCPIERRNYAPGQQAIAAGGAISSAQQLREAEGSASTGYRALLPWFVRSRGQAAGGDR
jgi:small subunit ribosomal protein S4